MLTSEPARRVQRLLAAARVKRDAGAPDAALGLLVAVEAGPLDALASAENGALARVDRVRPATWQRRGSERAPPDAWSRSTPAPRARRTWRLSVPHCGPVTSTPPAACGTWPRPREPRRRSRPAAGGGCAGRRVRDPVDGRIRGRRADDDTSAGAVSRSDVGTDEAGRWLWLTGGRAGAMIALELWDYESWRGLAARKVQLARDTGAPVHLQLALNVLAWTHLVAGELTAAARLYEEHRLIAEATGNPPVGAQRDDARRLGRAGGTGVGADRNRLEGGGRGRAGRPTAYASAVLYNGLGRHAAARDAAWRVFERDPFGATPWFAPELAEAASRTGDIELVRAALGWLSERTRVTPTDWVLGIDARVRALLSDGDVADDLYRDSIARLGRTRLRVELARGHLLYGEWLRRERRRVDAREQLRTAHDMLSEHGHRRVRRARPARAPGHRRDRPQAHPGDPRRADRPGGARSPSSPATASPTPRSPPACSSAHAPSNTTCTRSSPSSTSARATSSTASCRRPDRRPAALTAPRRPSCGAALATTGQWRMRARPARLTLAG